MNHATLKHPANGSKNIQLLITNQRVFYLKESCLFGTWDIEWQEKHSETECVVVQPEQQNVVKFIFKVGIEEPLIQNCNIHLKEQKTRMCILNDGFEKSVYCQSPELAKVSEFV